MGFFFRLTSSITGFISHVRDYFVETEAGEAEIFDEELIEHDQTPAEILAGLEEADEVRQETEQIISDIDTGLISDIAEPEDTTELRDIYAIEQEQQELLQALFEEEQSGFWPNWVTAEDIDHIKDEYQIYSYDDLSDLDKDFLLPGWRAFESADEPAADMDMSEMEQFRDEIRDSLNIPDDLRISDDDLLTLSLISQDEEFSLSKDFLDELEPEDLAEELELDFRGTFEDLESLLNSKLWEFIKERPDLFILDFDEDTGEVDVFERDNTP